MSNRRRYVRGEIAPKIIANFEKRWQQLKETDLWFQMAVPFITHLYLTSEYNESVEKIYDDLFAGKKKYNRHKGLVQLEILIANLIRLWRYPVVFSKKPNSWKKNRYSHVTTNILNIEREMIAKRYIKEKIGFYDHQDVSKSRSTRIWATEKLLDMFPLLSKSVKQEPLELVELRDWDGDLLDYSDFDKKDTVPPIRKILQKANEVNSTARILYRHYMVRTAIVAIFKEDFTMYGRLHTRGYRHLQGYSGDKRKEITINGQEVVELDYKALHPNLLYAEEGIQYTKDPYSVVDSRTELRPLLKEVFLCMLNGDATGNKSATKAANHALYKQREKRWDKQLYNVNVSEYPITDIKPIMEAFKSEHSAIAHHFCNGKKTGMKTMNKDSKIALDVVKHFVEQDIPILPIHDSFIVQKQYKKELFETMKRVYAEHTGGFNIQVR